MGDSLKITKRRVREKRTISQMVSLYCASKHEKSEQTEQAYCGELICLDCAAVDRYAVLRTERCRKVAVKTSCDKCPYHCYQAEERERIREIMRFSGPRMLRKHPIAALRHLLGC